MKIFKSPYTLKPMSQLNSQVKNYSPRGYLLKFKFDEGVGYSSLQTWEDFGDPSLNDVLTHLRAVVSPLEKTPSQIANNVLSWAYRDCLARIKNKTIFSSGLDIKNHYLVTSVFDLSREGLKEIKSNGFSTIKVKMGRELDAETLQLKKIIREYGFKWRIDFNSSLTKEEFKSWLAENPDILEHLDFIEDPTIFVKKTWQRLAKKHRVSLAIDFHLENHLSDDVADCIEVVVVKPLSDDVEKVVAWANHHQKRVVFTSYMDHPVAVMHTAFVAQSYKALLGERLDDCGLLTHRIYESDAYSNCIQVNKTCLVAQDDSGVGFSSLLENESWVEV